MSQRIYLGNGRARNYHARPGFILEEEGYKVFEVSLDFYCKVCDGCGCRCCGFSGEEDKRQARNKAGKNGPKKKTS